MADQKRLGKNQKKAVQKALERGRENIPYIDENKNCREQITLCPHGVDCEFFKLSYKPNPKLPCLAECLQLNENESYGKFIETNCDLKAGDIVGITEGYFKSLHPKSIFDHCSFCFRSNDLNLIKCAKCCNAMFCDNQCSNAKRTECAMVKCCGAPLSLQTLFSVFDKFDSVHGMIKFFESSKQTKTVFDFNLSNANDPMFNLNLLLSTFHLKNNADNATVKSEDFKLCSNIISEHPALKAIWNVNPSFFSRLLSQLCEISTLVQNYQEFSTAKRSEMKIPSMEIKINDEQKFSINFVGWQLDPFAVLLNGSCCPNIRFINVGGKNVWFVTNPIKAGEQLFRSYGEEFLTSSKEERRQSLMNKFGYLCKCDACVNDFPLARDLKEVSDNFVYDASDFDETKSKEMVKKFCSYINKNFQNFPSKEICYSMAVNLFHLLALAKTASSSF